MKSFVVVGSIALSFVEGLGEVKRNATILNTPWLFEIMLNGRFILL